LRIGNQSAAAADSLISVSIGWQCKCQIPLLIRPVVRTRPTFQPTAGPFSSSDHFSWSFEVFILIYLHKIFMHFAPQLSNSKSMCVWCVCGVACPYSLCKWKWKPLELRDWALSTQVPPGPVRNSGFRMQDPGTRIPVLFTSPHFHLLLFN